VSDGALGSGPISAEAWRVFGPLIDAALDLPLQARASFIAGACGQDFAMAEQLQGLIEECDRDDPVLDAGAIERFASLLEDDEAPRFPGALAGRYRVEREIARGGMAIVFLAHDIERDTAVAVKVMRPSARRRSGTLRFSAEIRTTSGLRHPRIVPLYDSGESDGVLYYVMPYYENGTLASRLRGEGQLPAGDAIAIASDVAAALEYAHGAGLIHRDIKPSNILFSGERALLGDFGVAREAQRTAPGLTATGVVIGTPVYMSPEQSAGKPTIDVRTDIYSLGCVLYEMLTGEAPIDAAIAATPARHTSDVRQRLRERRPGLPVAIEKCVIRATAVEPKKRHRNAAELSLALTQCARKVAKQG
jgi:serine/threonine-protein kinase